MVSKQPTERGEQRRLIILEAALDVFAESGYDAASLARIAEKSGVTQAGLLYHFPSKEILFARALEYREQLTAKHFDVFEIPSESPSALGILERLPELVRVNQTDPRLLRLFVLSVAEATNPEHPAYHWGSTRYEWVVAWYTQAFRRDQDEGRVRRDLNPEFLARELIAVMDGLNTQWLIESQSFDMEAAMADFVQALVRRITVRQS